jgi:hypothetical protein
MISLTIAPVVSAQFMMNTKKVFELKVGGGPSFYFGDLGQAVEVNGDPWLKFRTSHVSYNFNAGLIYHFSENLSFSGEFTFGKLQGSDASSTKPWFQRRNLSFFSPFYAFDVKATNVLWDIAKKKPFRKFQSQFYGTMNAGVLRFDPRGYYNSRTYRLQPLGTEGQFMDDSKSPYRLLAAQFGGGLGLRLRFSDLYSFGVEGTINYTTTDYLDDVSTTYAGKADMYEAQGEVAAHFSDPGYSNPPYARGTKRGSPTFNDYYAVISIYFTRSIGKKRVTRLKTFNKSPKPYWRQKQENTPFPSF